MANKIEKRKSVVLCYLTKEEKQIFAKKAKENNLTQSDLVRLSVLNLALPNSEHHKDIKELLKINADLARLGNLFKLAIDEGTKPEEEINDLIEEIKGTQDLLKEAIKQHV